MRKVRWLRPTPKALILDSGTPRKPDSVLSETLHSTARQAAELARDANVRLLALTHVSARYAGGELREEARAIFPATEAPRDFDTIEVPFPERGGPVLVRWADRQARERAQNEPSAAAETVALPDRFRRDPLTRS